MHKLNCKEARSHIEDALDETLSGGVKHRLDLHLQHCTECRAYFEAEKAEFARWCTAINHGGGRHHSLPADFADRLVAAVTAPRPLPFFLRLPRWALVAASVAVMAMSTLFAAFVVEKVMSSFAEEPAITKETPAVSPTEDELPQGAPPDDQTGNAYAFQSPFDEYTQSESGEIADVISTNTHTTQTDAESVSEIENKEGNGNMNMNKLIAVAAVAVSAALPSWAADGTWVGGTSTDLCEPLNWSGGVLPTDNASISLASAGTLTCSGTFSPKSITFPSGSAKVTIGGEGSITGILAITNEVSQHHVFNLPVTFAEGVEAIIPVHGGNYMDFAGGMTAYTIKNNSTAYYSDLDVYLAYYCGKITLLKEYEDWSVTDYKRDFIYLMGANTVLTLPGAENSGKANFSVKDGATLLVNGDFRMTRNDHNIQNCIVFRIEGSTPGTVKVTGKVVSSNKAQAAPFCYGTNGKFVVGGLEHGSSYVFMLNGFQNKYSGAQAKNSSTCYWWIGSGGITGNNGTDSGVTTYAFHTLSHANAQAHFTATEDFPINAIICLGANSTLTFNTTDPETGEGHTVTANAELTYGGKVTVAGVGKFLFNSVSTFSNGLIVNDSATVAVNAGKKPGNGAVTMNGTSTLKVAQSGTVSLGGKLTLGSTAALAFNFTDKTIAPQLAIPAASTIPATVNVKISADEGVRPSSSRKHTLTSTYDFTGKAVNLIDPPKWVKSVDVVGGNIVLTAKPKGLMVFVK